MVRDNEQLGDHKAHFDLLRSRVEMKVLRPAVIALTSSSLEDGKEVAALGLAQSLSNSGYATLLIDTLTEHHDAHNRVAITDLEEIGALQVVPAPGKGNFAFLNLCDPVLQSSTNQRSMRAALEILRRKFDYIVAGAAYSAADSFATSLIIAADAVLVTVRKGRRQTADDKWLSAALERTEAFLGVVALEASMIGRGEDASVLDTSVVSRSGSSHLDKDYRRREVAEWPT